MLCQGRQLLVVLASVVAIYFSGIYMKQVFRYSYDTGVHLHALRYWLFSLKQNKTIKNSRNFVHRRW